MPASLSVRLLRRALLPLLLAASALLGGCYYSPYGYYGYYPGYAYAPYPGPYAAPVVVSGGVIVGGGRFYR